MDISVPYGLGGALQVRVTQERLAGVVHPNRVSRSTAGVVDKALDHPIGSKPWDQFLADARDVLVIVNDATRPTPTAKVLETLVPRWKDLPVRFIVATGSHREPTPEECHRIFGPFYQRFRGQIVAHDARRPEKLVSIGTTSRGTHMAVNRLVMEADKVVVIGSVEPHYFAGFTGGRKAFLPGVASLETIAQNHRFALQQQAQTLALEGNPVHEDMVEAIQPLLHQQIFAIMTVVNRDNGIYACIAGDIQSSFLAATQKAREVFVVQIPQKADVVVTVAPYPTDINLFQSQKALENGKLALRDDGILILVSKCRAGIGDDTFVRLLSSSKTPREALDKIEREYKFGCHKAAKIAETRLWADIWAITDLEDSLLEGIFITPHHDLQTAIDQALQSRGPQAKILFLMEGSLTVPSV